MMNAAGVSAAEPVHLDRKGERWADATLRKMTLEEKIGQMMMVWAKVEFLNVKSPEFTQLVDEIHKYHVGGFGVTSPVESGLLVKGDPFEAAFLTNALQKESKVPLMMAADFERGASMRLTGATDLPAAMAFGAAHDPELAREFGRVSALEARAIGVEWNWAPVSDVNSNPANPIINTRSFGEDPAQVGAMVSAYIEGARSVGLLTTAKHFPGHGDTDTDSHLALARISGSMEQLNSLELVPFKQAIAAGVDSVMIGHLVVPAIEPDPNKPASISSKVVTGLLKDQLGFKGIVVTDGLGMAGLTHIFSGPNGSASDAQVSAQEAVAAVEAGDDVLCVPPDLDGAYNGLLQAVKQGKISEQRIDASVRKILRMKASVGLNRNRFVSLENVAHVVADPASEALAAKVSEKAITLVEDKGSLMPVHSPKGIVAVEFTDTARGTDGSRAFTAELLARVPEAKVLHVDGANARFQADVVLDAVRGASTVIIVAESVPSAGRVAQGKATGSVGLNAGSAQVLANILKAAGDKTIVAAFGNPYAGMGLAGLQTYVCTFTNTTTSAKSLVKALFGEIPLQGRLPITLPGLAARGAGLDRVAVAVQAAK